MYFARLTRTVISNGAHQEIELSASERRPLTGIVADLALIISNRCGGEGRGIEGIFIERKAREPDAQQPIAAGFIIITGLGGARLFVPDRKSGQAGEHGVQ